MTSDRFSRSLIGILLGLGLATAAAAVPRLEITPGSVALDAAGDTVRLRARWVFDSADEDDIFETPLIWSSSDPEQVAIDDDGVAVALTDDAFAIIKVESPLEFVHEPGYASVMVAELAPDVVRLPGSYVLGIGQANVSEPNELRVDVVLNEETASLEPGDAVNFGDRVSLRIEWIEPPAKLPRIVLHGPQLPLNELFDTLHVRLGAEGLEALAWRLSAPAKASLGDDDSPCDGILSASFGADSVFQYEIEDGEVQKLIINLEGQAGLGLDSVGVSASVGCSFDLPEVPFGAPVPLLGLSFWLKIVAAVGFDVSLSAEVSVETPSASLGLPFSGGLAWVDGVMTLPVSVGQPLTSIDPKLFTLPSASLEITGQAFFSAGFRVSIYPGALVYDTLELVHIDMLINKVSVGRTFSFPSEALPGPSDPGYLSPSLQDFVLWEIEPLAIGTGGLLNLFLEVLGIQPVTVQVSPVTIHEWEIGDTSPELEISNSTVYVNGGNGLPPATTITAVRDPWAHPFEPDPIQSTSLWRATAGGDFVKVWPDQQQAVWTPLPGEEGTYEVRAMMIHNMFGEPYPMASPAASIEVLPPPGIGVEPRSLSLSAPVTGSADETATVTNLETEEQSYVLTVPPGFSWLSVDPEGPIVLPVGGSVDHVFTLTCSSEPAEYEGYFQVNHEGEEWTFPVTASCDLIGIDPNPLTFSMEVGDPAETESTVLTNLFAESITWQIDSGGGPTPMPSSGALGPGASVTVSMTTACASEGTTTWDMPVPVSSYGEDVLHVVRKCKAKSGDSTGDPHLKSFDGVRFDFQALGEFVMARDPASDFEVQIRQEQLGSHQVALNTAAAMNVGGHRVALYVHPPQAGSLLMVDGAPVDLAVGESYDLPGSAGNVERVSSRRYVVAWGDSASEVRLDVYDGLGGYMSVFVVPDLALGADLEGILGNLDGDPGNDFALRDGTLLGSPPTFIELYGCDVVDCFAYEANGWINLDPQQSFFDYDVGEGPATFAPPPGTYFPSTPATPGDCDPALHAWALDVCTDAGLEPGAVFDACVLDVCLSGDAEIGLSNGDPVVGGEPPPIAGITCSSEYAPGWCQNLVDGLNGTCNTGEWATDGQPTGWARFDFDSPQVVTGVALWDRACDEQVLEGHIEFSDGSPDVTFGPLPDDGGSPEVVTFSPRTVDWIRVHLDVTSTPPGHDNPGLGEVVISAQ